MNINDQLSQHTQTGTIPTTVGQLSTDEYMKIINEIRSQPAFRHAQDKAVDYYDDNQLTAEVLADLEAMGFSQLMTNLIKPAINAVLGMEAKMRTDARATADNDQDQEVAEALSAKLAEAERESRADQACSDAYAGQVKAGLGWVHVARNSDPFLYPYKAEAIHRREMTWDWSTPVTDVGLDTSRYLLRQKWFPRDQVVAAMPQHADLLRAAGGGWQPDWLQRASENTGLMSAYDQESRISVSAWEWRNIDSKRVALQECWYATHVRGLVLNLGTRVVEFNAKNPLHLAAIQSGKFKPEPAVFRKLRSSMWLGPHTLQDADPGTNKMPYVPFWGYREDLTGVPYGLIRSMMPLQDEINARRRKLMWLLSSKRVTMDSDALDQRYNDFAKVVEEVSRPDSMIITNPGRLRPNAVSVESDLGLSAQQFEILNEAKQGIQEAAGIFNSVLGKADTGVTSGVAMNTLLEQSSNSLGEINDNFKFARRQVLERLMTLVRQDLSGRPVTVVAGSSDARRKVISLNTPKVDELTGIEYRENDVDKASVKVALEDIPSTPAYRAQARMMMGETIKALPPQAQAAMVPFYIEAGDEPKRHEMADAVRKALGMPVGDEAQVDPQVAQLQQQLQAVQQQAEQTAQHYEAAVQEQAQKAQAAEQQAMQLKLALDNKSGELQVRGQELALKSEESQAAAQEKLQAGQLAASAASAAADARNKELELKKGEMDLAVAKLDLARQELENKVLVDQRSGDHQQAAFEHSQLSAATAAMAPASTAEGPDEEAKELKQIEALIKRIVAPLAAQLNTLVKAAKEDAKRDASEGEGNSRVLSDNTSAS